MGATVYTDVRIYSIDLGEPLESCDLLENSIALILLAKTYEKNCYPHIPSWNFLFIGTEAELQNNMLPDMVDLFDDGISQGPIAKNGKALGKYLSNKLKQQNPIIVEDLHKAGYIGFSYSELMFNRLADKEGYGGIRTLVEDRYCHLIKSDRDIKKLVKGVMDIRKAGEGKWWHGNPWKAREYEIEKLAV
ncbi:MAG: hypothetical protein V3T17_11190 [Pseudomonadales bacterium]